MLGDNSVVGEGAFVHPNVRVWPDKEIEAGATVKSSIIWGAHARRVLFGRYGVTGLVNVDLTPEFAAKLPPMSEDENDLLDSSPDRDARSRLSCQVQFTNALDGLRVTIAAED